MGKYADKYFKIHPWQVIEEGFNPEYSLVAESIFSLGNEYMGLRGYFDEGYSGESLEGSYINGIYETRKIAKNSYRGMLDESDFMVNTVDWTHVRIKCNGISLDLAKIKFSGFIRKLDLQTGELTRSFVWQVDKETELLLEFERVLSMDTPEFGGQKIRVRCQKGVAELEVTTGLDFSRIHETSGENHWNCKNANASEGYCEICGITKESKQQVFAASFFSGLEGSKPLATDNGQFAGFSFIKMLSAGEEASITRISAIYSTKSDRDAVFEALCKNAKAALCSLGYNKLKTESAAWWANQWKISDIRIDGDDENQQGIRFCIFQMHQTLHTADRSAVIGAKGLTGEAYNGNTFWDSEVYCLQFYLFNNPAAAKNILKFRYDTLPEAKARARMLDCKGAFYPIATIGGRECCDLWQHASLQLQPSTGVCYGIWLYVKLTNDKNFLWQFGAEMLVEICRMLATRGDWNANGDEYGFYGVMGPDEFQMMVANNAYTNFMGKKAFEYTLEVLSEMESSQAESYSTLQKKLELNTGELADWKKKSESMFIPLDEKTEIFEQNEGYFRLPHVDIAKIPVEEFPLYSHWSYARIYRNDIIKQPDVLMFMLLYNSEFSNEQLKVNYDYYEPRCIHESSLSPSVHSILAQQLGLSRKAYEFFGFATRMDLDNYNRNTCEGLHTTSIAGAWLNIVYGFGGLRCDGAHLALSPTIPEAWNSYSFKLRYNNSIIEANVQKGYVLLCSDNESEIVVFGKPVRLSATVCRLEMPIGEEK